MPEEDFLRYDYKIYPSKNIKHIVEEWGPYGPDTSNEYEYTDENGNNYEFYFYAYDDDTNIFYLMDGFGSNKKPEFKNRKCFKDLSDTFDCSVAYEKMHSSDRKTYVIMK